MYNDMDGGRLDQVYLRPWLLAYEDLECVETLYVLVITRGRARKVVTDICGEKYGDSEVARNIKKNIWHTIYYVL
jgi:hypothetical protein